MLFQSGNDLAKYEADTGWREYWVWTGKAKGWIHRSHLFSVDDSKPLEILSPLSRNVPIPALDSDYGTPGYAKRQLENSPERQELKREYKRLKKKPMTVRKIY